MFVNHIAFLVRDLQPVVAALPDSCTPQPAEEQPTEGTLEQYIELPGDGVPSLLLMQPVSKGSYTRAMAKRGPGLHHLGGVTTSIHALLPNIVKHRLLLHPYSMKTLAHGMAWLCRPEVPFHVELMEGDAPASPPPCGLNLPSRQPVPDFVRGFFSNIELGNRIDDLFEIKWPRHTLRLALS